MARRNFSNQVGSDSPKSIGSGNQFPKRMQSLTSLNFDDSIEEDKVNPYLDQQPLKKDPKTSMKKTKKGRTPYVNITPE